MQFGRPLHRQANIEKKGPTGAGGASFGGTENPSYKNAKNQDK